MSSTEPPSDAPLPASPSLSIPRAYRDFTFGTGMWFGGWGMLQVLFSWLVVGELRAREELVGIAQLALAFPALFSLLIGGAVAATPAAAARHTGPGSRRRPRRSSAPAAGRRRGPRPAPARRADG